MDKVLVDTSAWINYFRKKEPVYSMVSKLLEGDRICCAGIVLAELIQGTKSKGEIKTLKDFRYVFTFFEESTSLWEQTGELSLLLKSAGKQVGLADCYIAVLANKEKVRILTLDEHFKIIKEYINIELVKIN